MSRTDDEIRTTVSDLQGMCSKCDGYLDAVAELVTDVPDLMAVRDALLVALNERRDRLIAVAIELDTLRAERDAAQSEVERYSVAAGPLRDLERARRRVEQAIEEPTP